MELTKRYAEEFGVSTKEADEVLTNWVKVYSDILDMELEAPFGNMGKFKMKKVNERKEHTGRNPKSGEEILIPGRPACLEPTFVISKKFKEELRREI